MNERMKDSIQISFHSLAISLIDDRKRDDLLYLTINPTRELWTYTNKFHVQPLEQRLQEKLEENYGILYLSDKSEPEEIKQELQMSKKNFKKAIGGLYKDQVIELLEDKIRLINEE